MNTRQSARHQLRTLVLAGLIIGAIGGLVIGLAWPRDEVTFAGVEQQGSATGAIVGSFVAWAGNANSSSVSSATE